MNERNQWDEKYEFRLIRMNEAGQAAQIEQICFPPNEACTPERMVQRIHAIPELFWVAEEKQTGKLVGFINGLATNEKHLRDEFFTEPLLHEPDGMHVMILGVDVLPEYRMQGLAREMMRRYVQLQQEQGRKALVLTCLGSKVGMYEKIGYRDLGESSSEWGGEKWHEMIREI